MVLRDVHVSHWVCLTGILLIALALRCFNLWNASLLTDEYLSLECSSGWARSDLELTGTATVAPDLISLKSARPWTSIWPSIADDENHPPLYFVLLRFWRELFGDSAGALRVPSVLASLVAIVLLFLIGVQACNPPVGLWAALLMALASPQIHQAQNARAYMPVTVACLAAALFLMRIDLLGPSLWRCLGLATAALLGPMMHYMAFASVAAMVIYAAVFMRGWARSRALLSLLVCLLLYALIWGPAMVQQHYRMNDYTTWLVDNDHHSTWVLKDLLSLPARFFLDLDLVQSRAVWFGGVALVLPLLVVRRNPKILLWWIWLFVPIVVALVIDLSTGRRSLSMIRYTLAAAPAMYLMLGMLAVHMRRISWLPATIIAGCCAICVPSDYTSALPDFRELSRFVARSSKPTDPVVFVCSAPDTCSTVSLLSISYYLASQHHPLYVLQHPASAAFLKPLTKANHICIIADGIKSLDAPIVSNLAVDRAELIDQIAVVGTADAPHAPGEKFARATFATDPALKAMLQMR